MLKKLVDVPFTRNYTVKDDVGTKYDEGQVVVGMEESSAIHFYNRGAAVILEPEDEVTKQEVEPEDEGSEAKPASRRGRPPKK